MKAIFNPFLIDKKIDFYLIGILLLIIGIIIYKLPFLNLPYYWDEAWSYSAAIGKMYESGLSLMPGSIPADNYRGHPLLFYFLAAGWMKIFGTSLISGHSFALSISILLLLSTYFFCKKFISPVVGFVSVLFFSLQQLFLSQSTFVMPEMMLALWTILTLYFYLKRQKIQYIIFASFAVFTKESALTLPLALFIMSFVENYFIQKKEWKIIIKDLFFISVPVLLIGLFFIIQRIKMGWFFFPEHVGLIKWHWSDFHNKAVVIWNFIFDLQSRAYISILFIVVITIFWKIYSWNERFVIALAALIIPQLFIDYINFETQIKFWILLISLLLFYKKVFYKMYEINFEHARFVNAAGLFVFIYIIFSALNFYTHRYLLIIFPLFFLIVFYYVFHILENKPIVKIVLIFFALFMTIRQLGGHNRYGDDDTYVNDILCHQEAIKYCEDNRLYDKLICCDFLIAKDLANPYAGYLKSNKVFLKTTYDINSNADYYIFKGSPYCSIKDFASIIQRNKLERVKVIVYGFVRLEIYKRNNT